MPHLINQLVSRLIIRFHANKIQPMYRNQLDFAPQKGYRSSTEAFSKFPKQRFIDIYQRLNDHHLDDSFSDSFQLTVRNNLLFSCHITKQKTSL